MKINNDTNIVHNYNQNTPGNVCFGEKKKTKNTLPQNKNSDKQISENMAIKYLISKAENGNIEAQILLGDMYLKGNGVEEDDVEAVKWYSMAVANGDAEAMSKLGEMYQYGYGVKANDVEAVKWYRKAAEMNSANGQFRLAWMYEAGRGGLPKDFKMALKYYNFAAKQGHEMAIGYAMYSN